MTIYSVIHSIIHFEQEKHWNPPTQTVSEVAAVESNTGSDRLSN